MRKKKGREEKKAMPGCSLSGFILAGGGLFGGNVFKKKKTATHLTNINKTELEVVKKADQIILLTWYVASSDGTIPLCLRMLFTRNIVTYVNKSYKTPSLAAATVLPEDTVSHTQYL